VKSSTALSRILADLSGFYEAFGFRPRAEDPIDHVAVGLVAYLLLKEGYARLRGESAAAEFCATARQRFEETHLSALAAPLAERLSANGGDHLAQAAGMLAARLRKPAAFPAMLTGEEAFAACGGCSFGEPSAEDEAL